MDVYTGIRTVPYLHTMYLGQESVKGEKQAGDHAARHFLPYRVMALTMAWCTKAQGRMHTPEMGALNSLTDRLVVMPHNKPHHFDMC
jgi:hypothetical protein